MSTNTGVSNGIQQIRKNVIKSDFHKYFFSVVFKISEHPSVFFHLSMWGGRMVGTAAIWAVMGRETLDMENMQIPYREVHAGGVKSKWKLINLYFFLIFYFFYDKWFSAD